ncbi:hypothetical protein [Aestuariibacter salexigens]|uniref:hypothetical protein n=1 Tax=Aestuariibacter salexigens TaxID=226010 RepID=UPI000423D14C|nr:hypothetical protein [Aestuariibacter salexigens]
MITPRHVRWASSFAQLWKDLALLVVGIYLALWMENTVQDWENDGKQKSYLAQLSEDLATDERQLNSLIPQLENKANKLEQAIGYFQTNPIKASDKEAQRWAVEAASTVNAYFFFTPQDFTFLSMRESGDFKLLRDDDIKRQLLKINGQYRLIDTLQKNYMQGLDDEFIPMWVRHADMINDELVRPEIITQPIFKNMLAFAWNETSQRRIQMKRTLEEIRQLRRNLGAALVE